jgi:ankyrin repeat protein
MRSSQIRQSLDKLVMHRFGMLILLLGLLTVVGIFCLLAGVGKDQALMVAVEKGQLEYVRDLLEKGADVNARDGYGWTALTKAAGWGGLEMVTLLLDKQSVVSAENKDEALGRAAWMGNAEVAKLLLTKEANVNARSRMCGSPLMSASLKGHLEVARLLLGRGADINAKNESGETALMLASKNLLFSLGGGDDHLEIARSLLEKGADVNARDNRGQTALMMAGTMEMRNLLLANGSDVDAKNQLGRSALMEAASSGALDIVKILLDKGADVNATDEAGWSPLMMACRWGHLEVVKLLLDRGANVNTKALNGRTALMEASARDDQLTRWYQHLWYVLTHISLRDRGPYIHRDLGARDREVVKLLLRTGADVTARDKDGWTALTRAKTRGHKEIVELLRAHGAKE